MISLKYKWTKSDLNFYKKKFERNSTVTKKIDFLVIQADAESVNTLCRVYET